MAAEPVGRKPGGTESGAPTPPVLGDHPVHLLLIARRRELVDGVVARLADEVPMYASLPGEALRGEVARIVEINITMYAEVLRTGVLPGPEALATLREGAARRAEEGVPLDAIVTAYHVGVQLCMEEVLALAQPSDLPTVVATCTTVLRYLRVMTSAACGGYLQARQAAYGEEYTARQSLLTALLDGVPAQEAGARAAVSLPATYLVLSLAVGLHADETATGVNHSVATRRKMRRLRVELERHVSSGPVLSSLASDGGLVLVPSTVAPEEMTEKNWGWLSGVLDHMTRVCGAEITAGVTAVRPDEVSRAALLAAEVREVAEAYAMGPGLYRLQDVLLEYQLTRPSPARSELAALLSPLVDRAELLETLRTHLRCALNRRRTATELQVHPNTVDYRLRKIASLTGLDTGSAADLPRITAALAALDSVRR